MCDFGLEQFDLSYNNVNNINNNQVDTIELVSNSGLYLGSLIIPNELTENGLVTISYVTDSNTITTNGVELGNTILDITITDKSNSLITNFDNYLTICLEQPGNNVNVSITNHLNNNNNTNSNNVNEIFK